MNISIHYAFLPHTDPEASLAFYRDALGFEVRNDVGYENMRWITVGPAGQPDTSIVLHPPAVDPGVSDAERAVILDLMAKGVYGALTLATDDLDAFFAKSRLPAQTSCRSRAIKITACATARFVTRRATSFA